MRTTLAMGLEERTVTVKREKLLSKLQENLRKHEKEYAEALEGYKKVAENKLTGLYEKSRTELEHSFHTIKGRIQCFDPNDPQPETVVLSHQISFNLPVPQDHSGDYRIAIQMAEWEVNDEVELTQGQFQCFVLDDWEWQTDFQNTSAMYTK
jgi:hypothetical protein